MAELLPALLVLGCMIVIVRFLLGGGRRGRVGRPPLGIGTRYLSPDGSPLFTAAMGAYALGTAFVLTGATTDGQTGLLIGLVVAIFMAFRGIERLTVPALGLVGFVCAVWQMVVIVRGPTYQPLESWYRLALAVVVFACFALGVLVFNRASALKGERGLCLLGIVDVVGFLSRPAGTDLFHLDQVSNAVILLVVSAAAFAIGWAVSEATLGLVVVAVLALSIALGGPDGWLAVVAACAALGFTIVARAFTRPVGL